MNREIKFRGMDIHGDWYYGLLAYTDDRRVCGSTGWFISNKAGSPFAYQVRPETIGQYTGLKDKNGKHIYEWDIISWVDNSNIGAYDGIGKVYYYENRYVISYGKGYIEWLTDRDLSVVIIGNEFENPELLEAKE